MLYNKERITTKSQSHFIVALSWVEPLGSFSCSIMYVIKYTVESALLLNRTKLETKMSLMDIERPETKH